MTTWNESQAELRRTRWRGAFAALLLGVGAIFFLMVEPEGRSRSRYQLVLELLGDTGRTVIALIAALFALYFLATALARGPAMKVTPEGVRIEGLARHGIGKRTVFVPGDEVTTFVVRGGTSGGYPPPLLVVHRRGGPPIEVNCYSAEEADEFVLQAEQVLVREPS